MIGPLQRRLPPVAHVAFLSLAAASIAGPPLQTDDPDTPGAGHWEINVATELERRGREWSWTPLLDVNYGLGERVQLKLKPRLGIVDEPGANVRSGTGNIQFGVKWRFMDESVHRIAVSVYPQLDMNPPGHSDDRGLVDDGTDLLLPMQFACTLGQARVYGEIGYIVREFRDDAFFAGLAFEYPIDAQFRWTGEVRFGSEGTLRDAETLFNVGFKARLAEHLALLASAGHTLRESPDERPGLYSYLGLQITF
jgi:hypothetical protein